MRVLVAESEPAALRVLRRLLQRQGFHVDVVAAACEAALSVRYDLIVLSLAFGAEAFEAQGWRDDDPGGAAVRVVIAEDQALLREGIVALLRENHVDVVACVDDGPGLRVHGHAAAASQLDTTTRVTRLSPPRSIHSPTPDLRFPNAAEE